jgi:hypothetical protein
MRVQLNILNKVSETNNEIIADIANIDDISISDDNGFMTSLKEVQEEFESNFEDEYSEKNWDSLRSDAISDLSFDDYDASDIRHGLKQIIIKELEPSFNRRWDELKSYLPIDELIEWLEKEGLVKAIKE